MKSERAGPVLVMWTSYCCANPILNHKCRVKMFLNNSCYKLKIGKIRAVSKTFFGPQLKPFTNFPSQGLYFSAVLFSSF